MKVIARLTLHVCLLAGACFAAVPVPEAANPGEEIARMADVTGHYGGALTTRPRPGRGFTRGDRAPHGGSDRHQPIDAADRACAGEGVEDIARRPRVYTATP